ncbi:amidohydrolase [Leucobacter sp. cx-328]|uniref:amidohydrolase n=1 Tax=unclassified Leucobacter TaxID=2621730 RepID=UPI00165E0183|nr:MULTISPECIES: amidohydrolase [unclassified Leucobacter]MBC9943650.1 amidohydrolase [Leucobacter sp. cx-328]
MSVDTVITGAQIWDPARSRCTALAIADGRIVAVGTDAEITALAVAGTVRIDAAGAALLPGFHDAHVHAQAGGLGLLGCDLDAEHSVAGYARLITEFAADHHSEWVVGAGWFGDAFPGGLPTKALLDELIPDRPAVFTSHDAHGVWVNSRALALAGIDASTSDPPAGRIVRDDAGEATGMLFDTAGELVTQLIPAHQPEDLRSGLLAAQEHLFSLGITAWHDAILGAYLTLPDCLPSYLETLSEGSLRARVTGSMWWPPAAGPEYLPEMFERIAGAQRAGFDVRSVKIMQDGICENCTAALIEPYRGAHPGIRGESVISPEDLNLITAAVDAAGFSVHFHGVGDRAVRECLDAVAHARAQNGSGERHQIAHLDVVHPADFERFAQLGVTANLQALWARNDQEILERKFPVIGSERARFHFPFGALERAGAHLAMGSDWPVTSPDPLWGLHTACTRTAPAADLHALNPESRVPAQPEQRLSVETAIRAYTLGAAEIAGCETEIGSIEAGKQADLVFLTGPILGAESFDQLRVQRTMLGGDSVYVRDPSPRV